MGLTPETLNTLGVSGVLLVCGVAVVKWLLDDRKRLLELLTRADERERAASDRRADELLQQARQLAQSSEVVRDALDDVTDKLERLQQEVERCSKRSGGS